MVCQKDLLTFFGVMALFGMAHSAEIYIGGGDTPDGSYGEYLADVNKWNFVRGNADGYYVNLFDFIEDLGANNPNAENRYRNRDASIVQMREAFAHKNLFYESEATSYMNRVWDKDDRTLIQKFIDLGFNVTYATVNGVYGQEKINALQQGASSHRPVFAMQGPWVIGGDINSDASGAVDWQNTINLSDGMATDGPIGHWDSNESQIKEGQYSGIRYAKERGKKSMIMLCPFMPKQYDAGLTQTDGSEFLRIGKNMVHEHEDNKVSPDIWVVSYYASQLQRHPVLPEEVDGKPANTVTGLAYWLIHHIKDSKNNLSLDVSAENEVVVNGENVEVNLSGNSKTVVLQLKNNSDWLDFSPLLKMKKTANGDAWSVSYKIGETDVSASVERDSCFDFVGDFRMNPNSSRQIEITFTGSDVDKPLSLELEMRSHATESIAKKKYNLTVKSNVPETPFDGVIDIPGKVETENYNNGSGGSYDLSAENLGGSLYRGGSVDIGESGEMKYVGWTEAGEWLKYSIKINETASYDVSFKVAAANAPGKLLLSWNDAAYSDTVEVPQTDGWDDWTMVSVPVLLHTGEYSMKLLWVTGDVNVDYIEFKKRMEDGSSDTEKLLTVAGKQNPLSVHGKMLDVDADGNFEMQIVNLRGERLEELKGFGKSSYSFEHFNGVYFVRCKMGGQTLNRLVKFSE